MLLAKEGAGRFSTARAKAGNGKVLEQHQGFAEQKRRAETTAGDAGGDQQRPRGCQATAASRFLRGRLAFCRP